MHIMRWEVYYEIRDNELNFHKWKLPLFHVFCEFNFLRIKIYVDKATLVIYGLEQIYLK